MSDSLYLIVKDDVVINVIVGEPAGLPEDQEAILIDEENIEVWLGSSRDANGIWINPSQF